MAERFEKLHTLPDNRYTDGSPIIIAAGALHKDTQTGKIIAQLKFQNISEKVVKAVKVSLFATDITNVPLAGVENYQFLDLSVPTGGIFGSDKAIVMPDSNCRFFEISEITVLLSDGTTWTSVGTAFKSVPRPQRLDAVVGAELVKQYQLETAPTSHFTPQAIADYWICACGTVNKVETCSHCRCTRHKIFTSFDVPHLTETSSSRVQAERLEHERMLQKKAEEEAQKQAQEKRNKKILAITLPSILAIIVFVVLLNTLILPTINYNKAVELVASEKYEEAILAFEALDGFKDSKQQIENCHAELNEIAYQKAIQTFSSKKYEEAYLQFSALGTYKESGTKATESAIKAGDTLLAQKNYDAAFDWYKKVGRKDLINEAKYQYVITHRNNDDWTTLEFVNDLVDAKYKDASSISKEVQAWKVEIIAVNSDPNSTQNKTSISKYDPVYVHFRLTGGTPNGSIEPYIHYKMPNGKTGTYSWNYSCKDGDVLWYGWEGGIYTTPQYGQDGTLTVSIYPYSYMSLYDPLATVTITITD